MTYGPPLPPSSSSEIYGPGINNSGPYDSAIAGRNPDADIYGPSLPWTPPAADSSFTGPSLSNSNSASGEGDSDVKNDTMSYWEGLLSSVGQQNELNRIFNDEQARLNRDFNSLEARKSRVFNAEEAEKSRQWSEEMSNTAFQRAVIDLQKAGLNPILAYQQGGASSPSSSSASSSPASGQNASYNVGGGDTIKDYFDIFGIFGSLFSSVGSLFKKVFGG